MKTLEVLDAILRNMAEFRLGMDNQTIVDAIKRNRVDLIEEVSYPKIQNSLDKLLSENYIYVNEIKDEDSIKKKTIIIYSITWEGDFFIQQGGYIGRLKKEKSENERLIALEENQKNTNNTMIDYQKSIGIMTKWIMIATIIAGVYYAIEILNHFFCIYPKSRP